MMLRLHHAYLPAHLPALCPVARRLAACGVWSVASAIPLLQKSCNPPVPQHTESVELMFWTMQMMGSINTQEESFAQLDHFRSVLLPLPPSHCPCHHAAIEVYAITPTTQHCTMWLLRCLSG